MDYFLRILWREAHAGRTEQLTLPLEGPAVEPGEQLALVALAAG